MKFLIAILCALFIGASCTVLNKDLLGKEKCTYGPSYWCSNIVNAKGCGAVKHCIKTVWEKQHVPEDTDSICKICLDMVGQARDQLESNETMEEIQQVFDGSCDLIPIKLVKKECKKLADDFIPELVEALASQMNPQVVCSTAGLCNNAMIDKMLEEYNNQNQMSNQLSCEECSTISTVISHKFHTSDRDQVLDGFLSACGRLSSFSDACSSLILTHFNEIYAELGQNLNADNICHMSGVCAYKFHQHGGIEIETRSNAGVLMNKKIDDDVPCELCEQLIKHLRDLLTANTTELEFKSVLEGLCKQTKGFKDECVTLVDQYYPIIYDTLVNNLDANGACFMIGICPKGSNPQFIAPSIPLVPAQQKVPKFKLGENEPTFSNAQIMHIQLPIDKLMGAPLNLDLVEGGQWCAVCQYFLHFLQEELSEAKNEDEIKESVGRTCDKFPSSIRGQCHEFVNLYGDAIIALLVQEIDPRELCPTLKMCPVNSKDVDVFDSAPIDVEINQESTTTCPLCVLVVKEAQNYIENAKTKDSVKKALDKVCSRLPPKPQLQCKDFVETYYDELLEKLLSDFSPKDICKDLKLCSSLDLDEDAIRVGIDKVDKIPYIAGGADIDTNEIPDSTANGVPIEAKPFIECEICTKIVTAAEKQISKTMKKDLVEKILFKECSKYHKMEKNCDNFVKQHADKIVKMLESQMAPKKVCHELHLCAKMEFVEFQEFADIGIMFNKKPAHIECKICTEIVASSEKKISKDMKKEQVQKILFQECSKFHKIEKNCDNFVMHHTDIIVKLLEAQTAPDKVCQELHFCGKKEDDDLDIDEALINVQVVAVPSFPDRITRVQLNKDSIAVKTVPKNYGDDPQCIICEFIMTKLESELKDKKTQDEIRTAVENICSKLPRSVSKQCTKFVEDYAELIITLVDTLPPKQICAQMGLCPAQKKTVQQLGKMECSWGPSHWCSDEKVAKLCNATKYCTERKLGKFQ